LGFAVANALWAATPASAQTQPDVVIQEFTGSNMPGVNSVWAAVLIGVALIILVAQPMGDRLGHQDA